MKKIILTLILLFTTVLIFAKDSPVISNQRVKQVGEEFVIDFNFQINKADQWYALAVYLSVDGGVTFWRTPLEAVSGDVSYVNHSGDKKIIWKVKEENDLNLQPGDNLAFKIKIKKKGKIKEEVKPIAVPSKVPESNTSLKKRFIKKFEKRSIIVMANVGVSLNLTSGYYSDIEGLDDIFDLDELGESVPPDISYGFGAGYTFGPIGFYAKFRSNFNFKITDYSADAKDIWASGESMILNSVGTTGIMLRLARWLQIYGGAGYGARVLAWEDVGGDWAEVEGSSYKGIAVDAGLILKFGGFFISGGVTTVNSKYSDMEFGIGLMF